MNYKIGNLVLLKIPHPAGKSENIVGTILAIQKNNPFDFMLFMVPPEYSWLGEPHNWGCYFIRSPRRDYLKVFPRYFEFQYASYQGSVRNIIGLAN